MGDLMQMPVAGGADDPLNDAPPSPPFRNAMPRSSASGSQMGAAAGAVLGGSPAQVMIQGMMQIEKLVQQMSRFSPEIVQVFGPAIAQGRTIAAASLTSLASGDPTGASAIPGGAVPPGPPGAGAGPGMPPMPPPMMPPGPGGPM